MTSRGPRGRGQPSRAWVVVALVLLAVSVWVLGRPEPVALGGDNETLHHPMFTDALRQVIRGAVPVWTSGRWAGSPLAGDPVLGAMYPPNYLGYLSTGFPHRKAIDVAACFDLAVFALGIVWCSRRLGVRPVLACTAAGLAIADPTVAYVARSWINWWGAMSWWPWLLGAVVPSGDSRRPRLAVAATSLAAQAYAGYPQFALYSGTIALSVLVFASDGPWRRRIVDALVVSIGGLGMAAFQLLPGLSMAAESVRLGPGGGERLAALDVVAIPAAGWLDIVAATPTLARVPCKIAPAVVLLAIAGACTGARTGRILAAATLACATLATGPTPLVDVLHHVPGFGFFAGPLKFFFPAAFLAHVLAGVGLEWIARATPGRQRFAVAVLAVAAWPSVGWLGCAGLLALTASPRAVVGGIAAGVSLVASAAFLASTAALSTPQPFARDAFTPLLRKPPPGLDSSATERWIALDQDRVLRQVGMNFGALWGISSVSGVGPLAPWREFEVLEGAAPGTAPELVRAVGATRVIVRAGLGLASELEHAGYRVIARDEGLVVLEPPTRPTPVFLAPRVRMVSAGEAVDAARRGMAVEPEVLVEGASPDQPAAGDAHGTLELVRDEGAAYAMRVAVDRPTWLVVRAPYYRGWEAWVDGRPATVHPAGGFLLGIRIDAGRHTVTVTYRERGLAPGLVITLCTIGAFVVAARRRATVEKAGRVA